MCFDVKSLEAKSMSEVVVSLKNISKCFKRYAHPADRLKEVLLPWKKSYGNPFWALSQINLEIARGETVGILGRNGSGKSTLLQIIAGTLTPTFGQVAVNGRVSALLELGSGFNPEFTGRQNVFFNGRILGLSQPEIQHKLDDIVAFAEIGDFLDQPVKTYSSGMFVRLAFAVAIHIEPQILIVDEALAVGDIFFQQKCFKHLNQLKSQGVSIILVSHDSQAIVNLCDRAVILEEGMLKYEGKANDVVAKYLEFYYSQFLDVDESEAVLSPSCENQHSSDLSNELHRTTFATKITSNFPLNSRYGSLVGLIAGVSITNAEGIAQTLFQVGDEIILSIHINPHEVSICPLNVGFQLKNRLGQFMIGANTYFCGHTINSDLFGKPSIYQFRFCLKVAPEQYSIVVAITEYASDAQVVYDWIEQVGVINIIDREDVKQFGLYQPDIKVSTTATHSLISYKTS